MYVFILICTYIYIYITPARAGAAEDDLRRRPERGLYDTPNPPTKSLGFEGLDSSRLSI